MPCRKKKQCVQCKESGMTNGEKEFQTYCNEEHKDDDIYFTRFCRCKCKFHYLNKRRSFQRGIKRVQIPYVELCMKESAKRRRQRSYFTCGAE